jgi:hypothetical protein
MKHCKVQYNIIKEYSEADNTEIVEANGIQYTVKTLPRPCATAADLYAVYINGVRYSTFAKFLKTVNNNQQTEV